MKPIDYLHLQMELEGIKAENDNCITRVSQDIVEFPLVLIACTSDEQQFVYFDSSLPLTLHNQLTVGGLQSFKIESAVEMFEDFGISSKLGHFKTYIFPDNFANVDVSSVRYFSQDDPKIVAFGFNGLADKVYAIEQAGLILSACVSSRQNSKSAEAWVFTHPNYRRKGLAQQVVTAWAGSLQREGIIPFYSHNIENKNSGKFANKLNLIHVFDETVIDRVA